MKRLLKVNLFILDEFLSTTLSECEWKDILGAIQLRADTKSLTYYIQQTPEG